jgi:hypothetical protein
VVDHETERECKGWTDFREPEALVRIHEECVTTFTEQMALRPAGTASGEGRAGLVPKLLADDRWHWVVLAGGLAAVVSAVGLFVLRNRGRA